MDNNKLKVLFVGVGSIAKRHIRNLRDVCKARHIDVQIDALKRGGSTTSNGNMPARDKTDHNHDELGIDDTYYDKSELPADYDIIFITNPTEYHLDTLVNLHNHAKHFFIEKPICSVHQLETALDKVADIKLRQDSVYYVACPLRYTSVIRYIKENINPADVISVRCISSSYLPDWRPGQDYRYTYSAHADLGGGVDIDLIHEWDYITYLWGEPKEVRSLIGRVSDLEIDSNDYAIYVASYDDKIVELHLDYFGRETLRKAMLIMKDDTVVADLVAGTITYLKEGKVIDLKEDRDEYQKGELEYFLGLVEENDTPQSVFDEKDLALKAEAYSQNYGIEHAIKVMYLTQGK